MKNRVLFAVISASAFVDGAVNAETDIGTDAEARSISLL